MSKPCTVPGCPNKHRARGLCSTHYNHRHQPNRHAARMTACVICSAPIRRPFKSDRQPTCSVACRRTVQCGPDAAETNSYNWATDAALRARRAGSAVVQAFDRTEVFERDGWTCRRCQRPVSDTVSCFDPVSPTVDHVVPLSKGGVHTLANVQTLCLRCNSSKQDYAA